MNPPKLFHEMTPCGMTARRILCQLEEVRQILAKLPVPKDTNLSRSAARTLAEDLVLQMDEQLAKSRIQQNPQEILSFLVLANRWSKLIATQTEVSGEVLPDSWPFRSLSIWFLAVLNYNEKNWLPECADKDDYGFGQ